MLQVVMVSTDLQGHHDQLGAAAVALDYISDSQQHVRSTGNQGSGQQIDAISSFIRLCKSTCRNFMTCRGKNSRPPNFTISSLHTLTYTTLEGNRYDIIRLYLRLIILVS
ncbi:uncharacterized protein BO96DRAFT_344468 [Aspergillus niger CBS 101883]|uniref:Uncharacterized protein n=2 Tax=Aspergillus niger TaxID=5061 RepID=A2R2M8_ASPNC|nr:uncharacterized protein BO96DRAFT_344468 [Aspergillus niger CBS 101883]XP_059602262.1 hypothetical protein An14g01300 [Aspergillus niger]PYH53773.1 hypothetical protein BO96DRAFT_344468 [Aspergillus niger CBS 101883]CAK41911.1 hypothetical protein An14g01300 [Aspergillus niger]